MDFAVGPAARARHDIHGSAMSRLCWGAIDFHCGGVAYHCSHSRSGDRPGEGVTERNRPLLLHVRICWSHGAREKMSKSLGNFYQWPDVFWRKLHRRELLTPLLRTVHYRCRSLYGRGMKEAQSRYSDCDECRIGCVWEAAEVRSIARTFQPQPRTQKIERAPRG